MIKTFVFILIFSFQVHAKIKLAITVDDLPVHMDMPSGMTRSDVARKMLKALKSQNVPEVYGFINAAKIKNDKDKEDVIKLWVAAGYPIGNHTFDHKSINKVSIDEFKKSIDDNEPYLQQYGSQFDWKYFRYPFLHEGNNYETRNAIREHLKANGYKIAQVTVDFNDWNWNNAYARCKDKKNTKQIKWLKKTYIDNAIEHIRREEIISQALFHRSFAHILLLHIGAFDAEMMPLLLKAYKKEGVEFIGLSEAVKDEAYNLNPNIIGDWGAEFTYQLLEAKGMKDSDLGISQYNGYPRRKLQTVCK